MFAALRCLVTCDCLQEIQEKILKREVDILLHLSHDNKVRFMNFGYDLIRVFLATPTHGGNNYFLICDEICHKNSLISIKL